MCNIFVIIFILQDLGEPRPHASHLLSYAHVSYVFMRLIREIKTQIREE